MLRRLLRTALLAALLGLAHPAWCGAADLVPPAPQLRFVRDGMLLHWPAGSAPPAEHLADLRGSLRVAGAPVSSAVLDSDTPGLLLDYAWSPRQPLHVTWQVRSTPRQLDLRTPLRPEPLALRRWAWPPVAFSAAQPDEATALALSPDGRFLAAGSQQGRLALWDTSLPESAGPLWTQQRAGRVMRQLVFSADGARLYVGEQGPEGRVQALDAQSGALLWHWASANVLGSSAPADPDSPYAWSLWPGIYALKVLPGANGEEALLVAASRSWPKAAGQIGRQARGTVLRLEGRTGALRWQWPADEAAPQLVTWLALGGRGGAAGRSSASGPGLDLAAEGLVAVPLQLPLGEVPAPDGKGASQVLLLDVATGAVRFQRILAPVPPFSTVTLWRGVGLHPGNPALALSAEDGRGMLFQPAASGQLQADAAWGHGDGVQALTLQLVPPLRLAGQTLAATAGSLATTEHSVLFATGATYAPLDYGSSQAAPQQSHPRGNMVLSHDWAGKLQWVWALQNDLQGMRLGAQDEADAGLLALLQGQTQVQAAQGFNGVTLLALEPDGGAGRLLWRFPLAGRVSYDAVALRGGRVALAEAPRRVRGDPRPRGAARLWVLR